ncbi:DNA-directed RNA polymerase III core subunit [Saccharomycopsis crataegensis]|uniref:DNA-directed RNA polymerase subunit n=1 Tax=Saccharomycopsis crataegensis TaxID=43959 RepID=A0AAV5QHE5_9ASCO|nr:DNA-directed RNA polymerase III core subunit [Saccharomycopsis crataegensis]
MKQTIVSHITPKTIKSIEFAALSSSEIIQQSEVEVATSDLFDLTSGARKAKSNGALDLRMGVSSKGAICQTCKGSLATCQGHFGHVRLALPVFHVGYFKQIINILKSICKSCSKILLTEDDKISFLKELRKPHTDNLRRMTILKKIIKQCEKQRRCLHCGALNGSVKKAGTGSSNSALKILHVTFRWIGKKVPPEKEEWDEQFDSYLEHNLESAPFIKRAVDDMNPLKVLNLFKLIVPNELELLGINPERGGRPENYIWRYLPVPPSCIRPSVVMMDSSNEDDLTVKLAEIITVSSIIRVALEKGILINKLMGHWDYLQACIAMYINSDIVINANPETAFGGAASKPKQIRGFCQRLKGKQGRFRGNLSGKRVDFSGRTVISPDPNLSIEEVAVPDRVAKVLTYPEKCTRYNREKLQKLIINGPDVHPGANYLLVNGDSENRRNLKFGNRENLAKNLKYGDILERHIEDGDIVLFNRQPSLHRLSILSHYARVKPWRTFRFNECVCTPYNADFDGDEMNLHVPQTEEARTEAINLMGVKHNLLTPKSGEPIIAATQDFITGSYLISHKDTYFDRAGFTQILSMMSDANLHFDIPPPAIMKPACLWTGKQVFSLLIKPNRHSHVKINLDAKNKTFFKPLRSDWPNEMSPNDGFVVIRNSEILSGVMDKSVLGDGKKLSVFYTILRDFGADEAIKSMNRMAKMCARYLANRGFSIGINDVMPPNKLQLEKDKMVQNAYDECDKLIKLYNQGKLETQPGCNEEQTLEAKIGGILSKVRDALGDVATKELDRLNAPLVMATCGSKGSVVNVSQMVAVVGQQIISGHRVPDGFQDRSLPHFPKRSKTPQSKGFVKNSFFSGLTPPEFLFHAISGREGLVDTAVKTAETGYMSRRLMKSLEDLSLKYDNTVRNSSDGVVQFIYGGDGLDPFDMEGDAKPVDFKRTWDHVYNITYSSGDRGLYPFQVMEATNKILNKYEDSLDRYDNMGKLITDASVIDNDEFADRFDSEREFYQSIRDFVQQKCDRLARVRKTRNLQELSDCPGDEFKKVDWDEIATDEAKSYVRQLSLITKSMIDSFIKTCISKYSKAKVEPGTAVGAIGAQSIGEPGTQMTLKTFHFAGVASMNVTLGVPRIKEIINASKDISTPIITANLVNDSDERAARVVKGRIEKTKLGDISSYIQDVYSETQTYIEVKLDLKTIERLQLELTVEEVVTAILKAPKLKITDVHAFGKNKVQVVVFNGGSKTSSTASKMTDKETFFRVQHLCRELPNVTVKGLQDVSRAVININESTNKNELLIEGFGLKEVMSTNGIIGTKTYSNHILEVYKVLGIEAARARIIYEIDYTMSTHGMSVDPRHIQLLGDVMTYKGEILGITRNGLAKMRDSVLQLASFEKTTDHLFDAAFYMKKDNIEGVSECIILGQTMNIGTGAFQLVQRSNIKELKPKQTIF